MTTGRAAALPAALVLAAAAACGRGPDLPPPRPPPAAPAPRLVSNITRADYAGTESCRPCHASHVERWQRSAMRSMTRDIGGADVRAPFDGATFDFKGDRVTFLRDGAERFVQISSAKFGGATYRVTRVIGGRHREDFAGIKVDAPRAGARALTDEEEVLPASWLIEDRRFRYKGYSVMLKERRGLRAGPVWNRTCIFCHNTAPYLLTALRPLAPEAGPYQGQVVDAALPAPLAARYAVKDQGALERALAEELAALGARRTRASAAEAVRTVRQRFRAEHLVEVGIGCESCHLGSRAHVADPSVLPSLAPTSPFLAVELPRAPRRGSPEERAANVNRACARCHQVLFSGYPHTWEGEKRASFAGGSNINSGEARDLLLGACATRMSCVDCHDPHSPERGARLRASGDAAIGATCVRCHASLAGDAARAAHSHHDPNGAGGQCVACHMPRKNMGLDGQLTRYHRVGSPNDPRRVGADRPVECALCHADQSTEALVSTMERWWKRPVDRAALRALYGDLGVSPLVATLDRGKSHELAVVYATLGAHGGAGVTPAVLEGIARGLTHELPIVRGYAKDALSRLRREPCPVDVDAETPEIERAARAWLARPAP